MSTPRSLRLPDSATRSTIRTERGIFACLQAWPDTVSDTESAAVVPPTALLLPGWTGSKEDYLAVLAPLAAAGYRVVAIDQRGQFETPGPEHASAYSLPAFGADAIDIADGLDTDTIHLVGHSFGGLVARSAVLTDPSRFRSVTLLCSGPGALGGSKTAQLKVMAAALPVTGSAPVYTVKRQVERASGTPTADEDIEAFLRERFYANSVVSLTEITRHLIEANDEVDALAATGVPAVVATGVDDDAWPLAEQAHMAERLSAEHIMIEGAGHSPAVDQPELTAKVLTTFWDSLAASG